MAPALRVLAAAGHASFTHASYGLDSIFRQPRSDEWLAYTEMIRIDADRVHMQ